MPRFPRKPGARGFSLVEMIAALTIFSLAVGALLEALATCLRSTSASLGYTQAAQLAQQAMEEAVAQDDFSLPGESGDFGPAFPRHRWTRESEETEQDGLYRVEVVVRWDERGRERQFVLTTLVAEREAP